MSREVYGLREADRREEHIGDYASLTAAVTAIGSTVVTLVVDDATTITANTTIPSTLSLVVIKMGAIAKTSTYTLTINGPFDAGLYQVFSGFSAGDVTFGAVTEVYPTWWGAICNGDIGNTVADTNSIQLALSALEENGGTVYISSNCMISSTLIYGGQTLRKLYLTGKDGYSRLTWCGVLGGIIFKVSEGLNAYGSPWKAEIHVNNINFTSNSDSVRAGAGISLISTSQYPIGGYSVKNCRFGNLQDGIVAKSLLLSFIINNRFDGIVRDAIRFDGTAQNNGNIIERNEFAMYGRYGIYFDGDTAAAGSNGNKIIENDFEGVTLSSLASIKLSDFQRGELIANRFEDGGATTNDPYFSSVIIHNQGDINFIGNDFSEWGGSHNYHVELTGSTANINFIGDKFYDRVAAIRLSGADMQNIVASMITVGGTAVLQSGTGWIKLFGVGGAVLSTNTYKILNNNTPGNTTGQDITSHSSKQFAVMNFAPTTGTWNIGDVVWVRADAPNPSTIADIPLYWYCSIAGTPGTWSAVYPIFNIAPATSASLGRPGMIAVAANYIYWNHPTINNTWFRSAGTTW